MIDIDFMINRSNIAKTLLLANLGLMLLKI